MKYRRQRALPTVCAPPIHSVYPVNMSRRQKPAQATVNVRQSRRARTKILRFRHRARQQTGCVRRRRNAAALNTRLSDPRQPLTACVRCRQNAAALNTRPSVPHQRRTACVCLIRRVSIPNSRKKHRSLALIGNVRHFAIAQHQSTRLLRLHQHRIVGVIRFLSAPLCNGKRSRQQKHPIEIASRAQAVAVLSTKARPPPARPIGCARLSRRAAIVSLSLHVKRHSQTVCAVTTPFVPWRSMRRAHQHRRRIEFALPTQGVAQPIGSANHHQLAQIVLVVSSRAAAARNLWQRRQHLRVTESVMSSQNAMSAPNMRQRPQQLMGTAGVDS